MLRYVNSGPRAVLDLLIFGTVAVSSPSPVKGQAGYSCTEVLGFALGNLTASGAEPSVAQVVRVPSDPWTTASHMADSSEGRTHLCVGSVTMQAASRSLPCRVGTAS